jgi:penicillin-binding protein 1A
VPSGVPPAKTITLTLLRAVLAVLVGAALLSGAIVVTAALAVTPVPEIDLVPPGGVPSLDEVVESQASVPSHVYAADGTRIGTFRPEQTYVPIEPEEIPKRVVRALLAAEDAEFFDHEGYDPQGIARAALRNLTAGDTVQGGSTITQQLAKNLITGDEQTIERKVHELGAAMELERRHSKHEILAGYLNTSFFGEGAIGIIAASRTYFGKEVDELELGEAALLVGLLPAPSQWNPRADPERAEERRQYVIDRLEATGLAPPAAIDAARDEVPEVEPRVRTRSPYPFFVDYVRRFVLDELGISEKRLMQGGLRIETTLDPQLQDAANWAVREHLGPDDPSAALAVVEPGSGYVRALANSGDWDSSEVNMALGGAGGGTGRQPGSSFKTFVLAAAMAHGWDPETVIPAPQEYQPEGADQPVGNATGRGYGELSIEDATVQSVNTAYMYLTDQIGPRAVARMARALGIHVPRQPGPSIAIGAYETSPVDLAAAYAVLAADGRFNPPTPVTRIVRPTGDVLIELPAGRAERVLDRDVARWVHPILRAAMERGTGTRAVLDRPAAGKTGTSNDYRDAWFAGYTPQLAAAVWVGYPTSNQPMRDVAGFARVGGGTLPAMIWHDVMQRAHEGLPVQEFPEAPPFPEPEPDEAALWMWMAGVEEAEARARARADAPPPTTSPTTTTPAPTTAAPTTEPPPSTTAAPSTTTTEPPPATTEPPPSTTEPPPPPTTEPAPPPPPPPPPPTTQPPPPSTTEPPPPTTEPPPPPTTQAPPPTTQAPPPTTRAPAPDQGEADDAEQGAT